jgi:hypothetical protein
MDFSAYLRDQNIVVEDPYDQEGLRLRTKIAVGETPTVFDNFYNVRGERIFCHVCGGHRHYKGITGLLDDGSRILFGMKCATDYFGKEVAKLHGEGLRRRTSDAQARYKILTIKNELESILGWLHSFRPLILSVTRGWIDIKNRHPQIFDEVVSELRRNGGRLVYRRSIEIKSADQKSVRMFEDEILTYVRSSDFSPYLTQIEQQLTLVDAFAESIRGLKHTPDRNSIANLNRMFSRMIRAADVIDGCLAFTADFFVPEKLARIDSWFERRRRDQLGNTGEITNRNVARLLTKIMGSGVPLPPKSLVDTIMSIDSMRLLAAENADTRAGSANSA